MLCFCYTKRKLCGFQPIQEIQLLFFQDDYPYFGLRVNSFQQKEINIDLRASLFQQEEFDTRVSSQLEIAKKNMWQWYSEMRLHYGACTWMAQEVFSICLLNGEFRDFNYLLFVFQLIIILELYFVQENRILV